MCGCRKGDGMLGNQTNTESDRGWRLAVEWTARLCLLFPVLFSGNTPFGLLIIFLAGAAAAVGILHGLFRGRGGRRGGYAVIARSLGTPASVAAALLSFFYALSTASVLLFFTAVLTRECLLPETPVPVLILPAFAAAVFFAGPKGGAWPGRRSGAALLALLWGYALLLLFVPSPEVPLCWNAQEEGGRLAQGIYEAVFCMDLLFAAQGLAIPNDGDAESAKRRYRRAALRSMAAAGAVCLSVALSCAPGTSAPGTTDGGHILWRDLLLLVPVTVGLTAAAGRALVQMQLAGTWMLGVVAGELPGLSAQGSAGLKRLLSATRIVTALAVAVSAAGFQDISVAAGYYRAWNLQILSPAMLILWLCLIGRISG